jgi:hypothetical protein
VWQADLQRAATLDSDRYSRRKYFQELPIRYAVHPVPRSDEVATITTADRRISRHPARRPSCTWGRSSPSCRR